MKAPNVLLVIWINPQPLNITAPQRLSNQCYQKPVGLNSDFSIMSFPNANWPIMKDHLADPTSGCWIVTKTPNTEQPHAKQSDQNTEMTANPKWRNNWAANEHTSVIMLMFRLLFQKWKTFNEQKSWEITNQLVNNVCFCYSYFI